MPIETDNYCGLGNRLIEKAGVRAFKMVRQKDSLKITCVPLLILAVVISYLLCTNTYKQGFHSLACSHELE